MWSILGSQSEERTPILGSGAGFAAHKQFLANVEAANVQAGGRGSERSTEKDICCPLQNRGKLDFMLGKQLYMCPSDMYLVANHIEGYNNKIQIATTAMLPGTNQSLNTEKLPPTGRPFIVTHGYGTGMDTHTAGQSIDVTPEGQPQISSSTMRPMKTTKHFSLSQQSALV